MLFGRHRHGGSRDDRDCSDRRVRDNLCARGCAPTATDVRAMQTAVVVEVGNTNTLRPVHRPQRACTTPPPLRQ